MDSDGALRLLGRYSRWQIESYIVFSIGFGLPFAWMVMSVVFIGDTPNYRCAIPENATLNDSIPLVEKDGEWVYDKCMMYVNRSLDNTTVTCQHGYWYDPESGYDSTLTTEWDLVCGQEWLVELSMTIASLGTMVGAFVFNRLADLYGRKVIFLACLWSNTIIALLQAFSVHIAMYIALSFIDGLLQQGIAGTAFILCLELFPSEQRTFAGNLIEFFWTFGYTSLVFFAYFIRNWRHLLLAITLPLVVSISFYWLVSESIPWLVNNGRTKEAEKVLRYAAKKSKVTLPDQIFDDDPSTELQKMVNDEKQDLGNATDTEVTTALPTVQVKNRAYSVIDVFRSPTLRMYSFVQYFIWFSVVLAYSAISLTVTYLPGDRYLNSFLYSLAEAPAYALCWVFSEKVGRRMPLVVFNILGGALLVGTIIQSYEFSVNLDPLIITLSVLGKTFITASFGLIYIIAPEVYPTNLRTIGLGMCQVFARVASIIGPFARTLARHQPWVPPVVMGTMCMAAGLLGFLLPETRHTKLPDTIEEVEAWRNKAENDT